MQDAAGLESAFLSACRALVAAQGELAPLLAETVGVPPGEVFYAWMERHFPGVHLPQGEEWRLQTGRVRETEWDYFFHGLECDLHHAGDGRHVRIEFGPRGRFDVLSEYAVLQFVMTSRAPWPEFFSLREYLADRPPPYDQFSGSYEKASALWDRLEAQGLLEPAAPDLCSLRHRCTRVQPDGKRLLVFPDELSEREHLDCLVAYRGVLSEAALRRLGDPCLVPPGVWEQIDAYLARTHLLEAVMLYRETVGCGIRAAKIEVGVRFRERFPELWVGYRNVDEDD
jgi:hypothetical protein